MKPRKKLNKNVVFFKQKLIHWHWHQNNRHLPWKGEKDVYKIWLSEVILQQTRVEQGMGYYARFVNAYPTIFDLADASEKEIFKLWEGLGYYSRCKNLIETARYIVKEKMGEFPDTYEELLTLKGVGPYTAAALASFGYSLPVPVVDGNVQRVLARYFGISVPVNTSKGKKIINDLADQCMDQDNPGSYNQAIMDFGAVICKPHTPLCVACMLHTHCNAYRTLSQESLPVKSPKKPIKKRWFVVFIIRDRLGYLAIRERKAGDIWAGLHDFPSIEFSSQHEWMLFMKQEICNVPFISDILSPEKDATIYTQLLSHQKIHIQTISCRIKKRADLNGAVTWHSPDATNGLAFPRLFRDLMEKKVFCQ